MRRFYKEETRRAFAEKLKNPYFRSRRSESDLYPYTNNDFAEGSLRNLDNGNFLYITAYVNYKQWFSKAVEKKPVQVKHRLLRFKWGRLYEKYRTKP